MLVLTGGVAGGLMNLLAFEKRAHPTDSVLSEEALTYAVISGSYLINGFLQLVGYLFQFSGIFFLRKKDVSSQEARNRNRN